MIGALFLLAQIAPVEAAPKAVATTIAAIWANPRKFNGQLVRLHGYVNRCNPLDCSLAERPATAPGGPGRSLSITADPRFDSKIQALLPTYVEIDARFDATCATGGCTDRPPVLTVVTLRGVVTPEPPPFENR